MAVIVVAASKGGVGKTTLSACLTVSALKKGYQVAIVDLDGHLEGLGSFSRWYQLREQNGGDLPHLQPAMRYPDEELQEAIASGADYVIVDTPPGNMARAKEALEVADLVVIPVRPSPIDVMNMDAIVDAAEAYQKPFVFVMNATKAKSKMAEGARKYLGHYGEVLKGEVGDRVSYASGFLKGMVGHEVESKGPIIEEMKNLWRAVEGRVKRKAKHQVRERKGAA